MTGRKETTKAGPRPMLQPWSCDHCHARGLLECLSSDDVLSCAIEIVLLHATANPYCDDQNGVRHIRIGEWREAEQTL